ncbi:hypothetical protein K488DRAFT_92140 [Vararia minispora EC-137]|uniref:Uncharacterized protein n=1 Tax=Vararia minispora EC-137 TaxID=1314806 RepID=A0ACB8Q4L1_9AGAM|nr:hypothetical protein K488DRAFT_92140 [Vararia minispora EC-137]
MPLTLLRSSVHPPVHPSVSGVSVPGRTLVHPPTRPHARWPAHAPHKHAPDPPRPSVRLSHPLAHPPTHPHAHMPTRTLSGPRPAQTHLRPRIAPPSVRPSAVLPGCTLVHPRTRPHAHTHSDRPTPHADAPPTCLARPSVPPTSPPNLLPLTCAPGPSEDAHLVYHIMPLFAHGAFCTFARVPPLLAHTSQYTNKSYFHPLSISQPARLHSHTSRPFLLPASPGLNVTLYTSSEPVCDLRALEIRIDIGASVGRIAVRYWMAVPAWGAGVAGYLLYGAWWASEASSLPPTTTSSLRILAPHLPLLAFLSLILALLPLPPHAYLSTGTLPFLAPLAPLLLVLATGLVCVSWGMLSLLITLIGRITVRISREKDPAPRATLTSLAAITGVKGTLLCSPSPHPLASMRPWLEASPTRSIYLYYVPGHAGIPFNEAIDRRANHGARTLPQPDVTTAAFQRQLITERASREWRRLAQHLAHRGQQLIAGRRICPSTEKGGPLLCNRRIGHSNTLTAHIARALLNHAPTGEYRARFFPREDRMCPECGVLQSRSHILDSCPRYASARRPNFLEFLKNSSSPGDELYRFCKDNPTAFTFEDAPPTSALRDGIFLFPD